MHSFRSTTTKTKANSERISLTHCFVRCYFIRLFGSSRRGRTHFGKSVAHDSHSDMARERGWGTTRGDGGQVSLLRSRTSLGLEILLVALAAEFEAVLVYLNQKSSDP